MGNILQGLGQGFKSFATNTPLSQIQDEDRVRELTKLLQGSGDITSPEFQELSTLDPTKASKIGGLFGNIGIKRETALFRNAQEALINLKAGNNDKAADVIFDHVETVKRNGGDPKDAMEIAQQMVSGDIAGAISNLQATTDVGIAQGFIKDPDVDRRRLEAKGTGQREFENLLRIAQDPTSTEVEKNAALRKLGAKANVSTTALERIADDPELATRIAKTQAEIEQNKTFGKLTGSSRAKAIDAGIKRIETIDLGITNLDKAIELVAQGAGVGVIESQLPSLKAASVELDFIQKKMALDVIGAVTFGALSKGELDLAKEVALPTGLDSAELTQHLQNRKVAQQKLRDYFNDQIQFLDQGGTVAGFLREQERSQGTELPQEQPAAQPIEQAQPQALNSSALGREVSEQDIQDTLSANPGMTREQLLQQLGIQ